MVFVRDGDGDPATPHVQELRFAFDGVRARRGIALVVNGHAFYVHDASGEMGLVNRVVNAVVLLVLDPLGGGFDTFLLVGNLFVDVDEEPRDVPAIEVDARRLVGNDERRKRQSNGGHRLPVVDHLRLHVDHERVGLRKRLAHAVGALLGVRVAAVPACPAVQWIR